MKPSGLIRQRLLNQKLIGSACKTPDEVVHWMIAMQAQEFAMAKWAIGLRLPGSNEVDIEQAFNNGDILRTHLLRPTWHFITAPDIRWVLALTAPHINAASAYYHRQNGLDKKIFKRCNDILAKSLEGGKHLTREQLQSELRRGKIVANGIKLAYIMMVAELDGIICSGARSGKQFTYALLDERAPAAKSFSRDEALALLAERFFASRGPATIQDLSYWSGLTIKDVKTGVASLPADFKKETFNGKEYIFLPSKEETKNKTLATFLMPDYDEYGMSYKDRDESYNKNKIVFTGYKSASVFNHMLVVDGVYGGSWTRTVKGKNISIAIKTVGELNNRQQLSIKKAEKKYIDFFDVG